MAVRGDAGFGVVHFVHECFLEGVVHSRVIVWGLFTSLACGLYGADLFGNILTPGRAGVAGEIRFTHLFTRLCV